MFAFFAALNVLDARALYSPHTVRELMDPAMRGTRSTLERHHLFPVAYLKRQGIVDKREYNQIANYAIVEWGDNSKIADLDPCDYVPIYEQRFDTETLKLMYRLHALPLDGKPCGDTFVKQRRDMMAQTIREAYERLVSHDGAARASVANLINSGESSGTEFKSTLRRKSAHGPTR